MKQSLNAPAALDVLRRRPSRLTAAILFECASALKKEGRSREAYELAMDAVIEHPQFGYPGEHALELCGQWIAESYRRGEQYAWRHWQLVTAAFHARPDGEMLQLPVDTTEDELAEANRLRELIDRRRETIAPYAGRGEVISELSAVADLISNLVPGRGAAGAGAGAGRANWSLMREMAKCFSLKAMEIGPLEFDIAKFRLRVASQYAARDAGEG